MNIVHVDKPINCPFRRGTRFYERCNLFDITEHEFCLDCDVNEKFPQNCALRAGDVVVKGRTNDETKAQK